MDVPTDIKDWWIYLMPGDLLLIEILFLYDIIKFVMPTFSGPKFEIASILSYNEAHIALFLLLIVTVGLITGSLLEGLSYRIFERLQKKSAIISIAFQEARDRKSDLVDELLSDSKLFPEKLWKGSFDAMKKNIEGVAEFIEAKILHEAEEDESESLNETAVAITFTQSFFLSFIFFLFIICWMIVREFVGIGILFGLFYIVFLIYLWKDQSDLTKIYWLKTFNLLIVHLQKKKSEILPPDVVKKQSMKTKPEDPFP